MRITWIVPHFPPHIGGGEKLYMDICLFLKERGNEVRVVTSSSGGITGYRSVKGVRIWYCDWPLFFGHPLVRMTDILPHVKWCDIVHTSIYSTALKANLASLLCGKKCVTTIHEVMDRKWFWFEKNPLKAAAFFIYERLIVFSCPLVHVVSGATASDYRAAGGRCKKPFMIYNYPDLPDYSLIEKEDISFRSFFSLKEGERGILFFGRPAKNKGIFVLLKALSLLPEKEMASARVRFCFILAKNPGQDYRKAIHLIRKLDQSGHITVKPPLPRLRLLKVLSGADCCIIPSVTEGFGYAAAEACVLKRAVISSDAGSLKEVVGGRCLFFKNRDAKDLAAKLRLYLREDTKAFSTVEEKHFDKLRIIRQYTDMYSSLLRSPLYMRKNSDS